MVPGAGPDGVAGTVTAGFASFGASFVSTTSFGFSATAAVSFAGALVSGLLSAAAVVGLASFSPPAAALGAAAAGFATGLLVGPRLLLESEPLSSPLSS